MLKKIFAPKTKEGNNLLKKVSGTIGVLGLGSAGFSVENNGLDLKTLVTPDFANWIVLIEALAGLIGIIGTVYYQIRESNAPSETI